jgi:hypothetical protein
MEFDASKLIAEALASPLRRQNVASAGYGAVAL